MTLGFMQAEYQRLRVGKPLAVRKSEYRCAGLSSCQSTACLLVQAREAATYTVVIHIHAVSDSADAVDNLSSLIEFKRHFGQVVEIAVWMCAHHERNLWFGEPDLNCRFHQTCSFCETH